MHRLHQFSLQEVGSISIRRFMYYNLIEVEKNALMGF